MVTLQSVGESYPRPLSIANRVRARDSDRPPWGLVRLCVPPFRFLFFVVQRCFYIADLVECDEPGNGRGLWNKQRGGASDGSGICKGELGFVRAMEVAAAGRWGALLRKMCKKRAREGAIGKKNAAERMKGGK